MREHHMTTDEGYAEAVAEMEELIPGEQRA
jgi:hypothetical protein